jgi:hypothetical protein
MPATTAPLRRESRSISEPHLLQSWLQTLAEIMGKNGNEIALASLRLIGHPKEGGTMEHHLYMAATQQA